MCPNRTYHACGFARAAWARVLVGVWPRARWQARAFGPADLSFGTSRFASAVVAISWRISDDDSNYHHHHNDDNNNNDDDDDDITNARQIVEMLQGKLVLTGGARTQVARASQYNLPDSLHRQGRSRIAVARRRPQAMRSSLRSRRYAVARRMPQSRADKVGRTPSWCRPGFARAMMCVYMYVCMYNIYWNALARRRTWS